MSVLHELATYVEHSQTLVVVQQGGGAGRARCVLNGQEDSEMLCEALMKTSVEYVSPQDTVAIAARVMRDRNIGFLPVCDDSSERAIGTLTDRDIATRLVADRKPGTARVEAIMTRDVVACHPQDDITRAEELMAENLVSRVMCIDDEGQLVGVISLSDIAMMDGMQAARTLEQVSAREASFYAPLWTSHPRARR